MFNSRLAIALCMSFIPALGHSAERQAEPDQSISLRCVGHTEFTMSVVGDDEAPLKDNSPEEDSVSLKLEGYNTLDKGMRWVAAFNGHTFLARQTDTHYVLEESLGGNDFMDFYTFRLDRVTGKLNTLYGHVTQVEEDESIRTLFNFTGICSKYEAAF
jgi:hypothetical protein